MLGQVFGQRLNFRIAEPHIPLIPLSRSEAAFPSPRKHLPLRGTLCNLGPI
jgi:hypothetical protein